MIGAEAKAVIHVQDAMVDLEEAANSLEPLTHPLVSSRERYERLIAKTMALRTQLADLAREIQAAAPRF